MKRLDTNSKSNNDIPIALRNPESDNTDKTEVDSNSAEIQSSENNDTMKLNIWKEKPVEDVEKTREKEFEEYLEDLLM